MVLGTSGIAFAERYQRTVNMVPPCVVADIGADGPLGTHAKFNADVGCLDEVNEKIVLDSHLLRLSRDGKKQNDGCEKQTSPFGHCLQGRLAEPLHGVLFSDNLHSFVSV